MSKKSAQDNKAREGKSLPATYTLTHPQVVTITLLNGVEHRVKLNAGLTFRVVEAAEDGLEVNLVRKSITATVYQSLIGPAAAGADAPNPDA